MRVHVIIFRNNQPLKLDNGFRTPCNYGICASDQQKYCGTRDLFLQILSFIMRKLRCVKITDDKCVCFWSNFSMMHIFTLWENLIHLAIFSFVITTLLLRNLNERMKQQRSYHILYKILERQFTCVVEYPAYLSSPQQDIYICYLQITKRFNNFLLIGAKEKGQQYFCIV